MLLVKIGIVCALGVITFQDIKDRQVYAFVLLLLIGLLGLMHYQSVMPIHFLYAVGINISVVGCIMMVLYLYATYRLKRSFFTEVFGLGDLLFFLAVAIGFPTVTFTILFVFSLLFSILAWILLKNKTTHTTVPLAGFMALFLGIIFIANWMTNIVTLYTI